MNATNGTVGNNIKTIKEFLKLIETNSMIYRKIDKAYIGYRAIQIANEPLIKVVEAINNGDYFYYNAIKL